MKNSNYICILEAENEQSLINLLEKAKSREIANSYFQEPDFENTVTAIALAPGEQSRKLCSNLRLALKA